MADHCPYCIPGTHGQHEPSCPLFESQFLDSSDTGEPKFDSRRLKDEFLKNLTLHVPPAVRRVNLQVTQLKNTGPIYEPCRNPYPDIPWKMQETHWEEGALHILWSRLVPLEVP